MNGEITDLIDKLEDMNRRWADRHSAELKRDLGELFDVGRLTKYGLYDSIDDNFFPVQYKSNSFGIILPFRNKAFGANGCSFDYTGSVDHVFIKFKKVLENKGYNVKYFLADTRKLVERGRKE